jgi:hypothetical protein
VLNDRLPLVRRSPSDLPGVVDGRFAVAVDVMLSAVAIPLRMISASPAIGHLEHISDLPEPLADRPCLF